MKKRVPNKLRSAHGGNVPLIFLEIVLSECLRFEGRVASLTIAREEEFTPGFQDFVCKEYGNSSSPEKGHIDI